MNEEFKEVSKMIGVSFLFLAFCVYGFVFFFESIAAWSRFCTVYLGN